MLRSLVGSEMCIRDRLRSVDCGEEGMVPGEVQEAAGEVLSRLNQRFAARRREVLEEGTLLKGRTTTPSPEAGTGIWRAMEDVQSTVSAAMGQLLKGNERGEQDLDVRQLYAAVPDPCTASSAGSLL
eukprot:TRINITY_DN18093_c0_g2_i1.p1 TRINITY_DN18093_c0_g2~~TRINITY_DN18093_c0_g2_i1.p1  ORF type:complete len:143 (+),score=51.46 TRINITY_DN18093_c0_g2_i1:49-429(+)